MVTAVIPRFFVDKQTSQPQGSRVIDWSNPLTRGLIGAFLPDSPSNIVDGERMYQDWLPPSVLAVRAQSGGKVLGNGGYTYQPSTLSNPYGYRFDLTSGAALIVASQESAQNDNIALGRAATSGSQYWGIGLHGGTFNGARGVWGTFSFTPSSGAAGITLQKRTVIINADGSTATLYMDGGVVSSGAYTMPAYDSGFRNRCFGFGGFTGGFNSNGTIRPSVGLVWNRPLTENEVALLTANPWQVFRSPQRAYTPLFDSTPSPTSRTFFIPRKKVMTSQPQGSSVSIDWGNPITQGLASAYLPTTAQYRSFDLATNTIDTTSGAEYLPPYRAGAAGVALDSTDNNYVWSVQFNPVALRGYPRTGYAALTVFSLFERSTAQSGVIYGGGESGTYYARHFIASTGAVQFLASSNNVTVHPITPVLSANTVYSVTGVQRFSQNYRAIYLNGNLSDTNTSSIINLNNGFFAGSVYNVQLRRIKLYCGYVWVRELSAAEIKSLSDNPWQIFKQPRLGPALAEEGKVYAPFMS